MANIFIKAYSNASKSAKALANAMGIKLLRQVNSKAKPRVVIRWGRTGLVKCSNVINKAKAVNLAINKRYAFEEMKNNLVSIPDFTSVRQIAESWLDGKTKVVCRSIINGHEGKGITIINTPPLPNCPLYSKYIPKKKEFRIHVIGGKIIDRQQKVRSSSYTGTAGFEIRNTANGFIFQRTGIVVPIEVDVQSLKAVQALGLDFGAVDIIWNDKKGKAYVLEVNTAPGLEGTSLTNYATALKQLIKDRFNV